MQMILKKFVSFVMLAVFMISACGCKTDVKNAETVVKAYMTAVSSYNLDIMKTFLSDGTNKDFGIDAEEISETLLQIGINAKSAETMIKSLAGTIGYTINSTEKTNRKTVVVDMTVQYPEVEQETVRQYIQQQADAYISTNSRYSSKTGIEQRNIYIAVMVEAYKTYLQTQNKISRDVSITLVKKDGTWKILNGAENRDLAQLLADIFATF